MAKLTNTIGSLPYHHTNNSICWFSHNARIKPIRDLQCLVSMLSQACFIHIMGSKASVLILNETCIHCLILCSIYIWYQLGFIMMNYNDIFFL